MPWMDQALTATRAQNLNPDIARRWLDEWNRQQEGYVRFRDCRFEIIADALNASGLVAPVILDLGCGPGSLGDRLAARLPGAEIVGLDYDPVLLTLARVLHADDPDRSWIELDMRRHDWVDYLEGRQFDAVVSTTALHWLGAPNLMRVYQDLTRVLAPGGVFVNGDICSYDQTQPTLRRMAAASIKANRAAAQTEGAHDWVGWWNSIAEEPALTAAVAERHRRFSNLPPKQEMTMEFHLAALRQVGFREVGCIWRYLSDYLALALL
jgi:SAM-dependent methyltransferase